MFKKIFFIILFLPTVCYAKEDMSITMLHLNKYSGDGVLLESNGEYLLMDTFTNGKGSDNALVNYLAEHNIFNLSVYISHYHEDHYGGLLSLLNDNRFNIKKVYLPKTQYFCKYYNIDQDDSTPYFYNYYQSIQILFNKIISNNVPYEFLWPTNTPYPASEHCFNINETSYNNKITIGNAKLDIIGPVGDYTLDTFPFSTIKVKGNWYINSYSLVTIVSGGGIKFFTAGDITKNEEANLLVQKPDFLKADIMKISHHGASTSNTLDFVKKVSPNYMFVMKGNDESITTFEHLLTPEQNCTNNCYKGANVFVGVLNGITTFHIEDGKIQAEPTKNYNTITFEYYDDNDQSLIKKRNYKFWTGQNYYLDDSYQEFPGYTIKKYDKDVVKTGLMEKDITYKVYLNKNEEDVTPSSSESKESISVPNTLSKNKYSRIIIFVGIIGLLCGGCLILFNIKSKKKIFKK